ncbi:hypothetical protein Tco_1039487 [Tanacetum coccineum]
MDQPQSSQQYSPVNRLTDEDLAPSWGSQAYSTGQGSCATSRLVEDDSPVEEAASVKKTSKRRKKSKATIDKEAAKPWTPKEELTLCGFSLNEDAYDLDAKQEEVQEVQPMDWTELRRKRHPPPLVRNLQLLDLFLLI